MPELGRSPLELNALLEAVEAAPPIAAADVVGAALAEALGAREVSFLIADFGGGSLVRLGQRHAGRPTRAAAGETAEHVGVAGTPHGRALEEQTVVVVAGENGAAVHAPVTSRGEAVGVLELRLPYTPDEEACAAVGMAAHALAYVIIANRRYTDLFEWGRRSVPLSLAAEIQHRLLPGSFTCEAGQFTVAGWLEPAGDVGGDTFDFSVERETLHLSMTDAMGHTVDAALLATLAVGALRNARRQGGSLVAQAAQANVAIADHARTGRFVTGQLVRVDLATQTAGIVNAGHPPPVRIRDGRAETIVLDADLPFGTQPPDTDYEVQRLDLRPGDRFVFLTDGVLERNAAQLDVHAVLTATRDLHAREAVQHLAREVLRVSGGELRDDATALCLDWHGGEPRDRRSATGADF
jgi:serine phosphatase RsbU (regulator of sigma subunit)